MAGPDNPTILHFADSDQETDEMKFLGFLLAGEEYVVDISVIQEIIRPVEVTPIPRIPDYINGIITLRGTIIPIFDLRKRLNLVAGEPGQHSRFIIASCSSGVSGMLVDAVTEVIRVSKSEIEATPCNVTGKEGEFIEGISTYKGRMVILLDYERVLAVE
jgi:purine-binding chemotaxis protein CheW